MTERSFAFILWIVGVSYATSLLSTPRVLRSKRRLAITDERRSLPMLSEGFDSPNDGEGKA